MMLNIAVVTQRLVCLSGDFRLTDSETKEWRDDFNIQKLVPVVRYEWCAMISYCGRAYLSDGTEIGEWLANRSWHNEDETLRDFLNRIEVGTRKWFPFKNGDPRLTMRAT